MGTDDRLVGFVSALGSFALFGLLWLFIVRIARPVSRTVGDRLRLDAIHRRAYGPVTGRVLEFLDFALYTRRIYGPATTNRISGALEGAAIEPGVGIGPVWFGASPEQSEAAFGPSQSYDAWGDGNLNDSLIFDGVRLHFDRHDSRGPLHRSRLCGAEVRRADATLFGRPLADWSEKELIAELARRGFHLRVVEAGYVECDPPNMRAWFEAGQFVAVEIARV